MITIHFDEIQKTFQGAYTPNGGQSVSGFFFLNLNTVNLYNNFNW